MAAVLAPWPFLDGGATAVQVATIFDGATVEEELLWRDGPLSARVGGLEVRLGAGGFELAMARTCEGEVAVGARVVDLRELSLCGVGVLPLGPRTRVTVRAGLMTFTIAGTTPPRRLPLASPASWRQRVGIAAAALLGGVFAVALHATAPRTPTWIIPDSVRVKVSLMLPSLHGGRAPSVAEQTSAAHTTARATVAAASARKMPNQDRAKKRLSPPPPPSSSSSAELAMLDLPTAKRAASADDARQAAAMQAHAAGIVGALAQFQASFLGDQRVAASDVSDSGSIALGAGDASSANGAASGNDDGSGSANGSGSASSSGSSDGDSSGALEGDEIGEAYGDGGLGMSGIGEGGGGDGVGTIGLGDIGTIGHGTGTGTGYGYGYGYGVGGLGGRRASAPVCNLGRVEVRGSCDADLIRRVMRAHANEIRFCYERVLQSKPSLSGRSVTRFVIGVDGHVAASSAAGFPEVDTCLAAAIRRWEFSRYCAASISWPIIFVPTSAP